MLGVSCAAAASLTPPAYFTEASFLAKTASPTASPTITPGEHLAGADRLLANGQYAEAVAEYQSLRIHAPEAVLERALLGLGIAYFQAGNYQQAMETLHRFVTQYPGSVLLPRALVALAQACESLGQWRSAVETYARVLPLEPGIKAYLYSCIGDTQVQAGDDGAAVDAYTLAAKADAPLSVRVSALENMGDALRRLGRPGEAIVA